jgi:hypothetical protein
VDKRTIQRTLNGYTAPVRGLSFHPINSYMGAGSDGSSASLTPQYG